MLSTTSSAPASCVSSAIAAMSAMPSSGLVGVSSQTTFVVGRTARPARRRRRARPRACARAPSGPAPSRTAGRCRRTRHPGSRRGRPGRRRCAAGCPPRRARTRTQGRAGRPRSRPGTPPARCGWGWRCGCTRSRRAARRPRPACRSRSGRSAGRRPRSAGPAPGRRGSRASRSAWGQGMASAPCRWSRLGSLAWSRSPSRCAPRGWTCGLSRRATSTTSARCTAVRTSTATCTPRLRTRAGCATTSRRRSPHRALAAAGDGLALLAVLRETGEAVGDRRVVLGQRGAPDRGDRLRREAR